jgi:hypothetical protein
MGSKGFLKRVFDPPFAGQGFIIETFYKKVSKKALKIPLIRRCA